MRLHVCYILVGTKEHIFMYEDLFFFTIILSKERNTFKVNSCTSRSVDASYYKLLTENVQINSYVNSQCFLSQILPLLALLLKV